VTSEAGQPKKSTWRQRTTALRRRVLWWMHRYLAFDVAPPADDPDADETAAQAEEIRNAPRRRVVETPAPRLASAPVRRVVRASAETIPSFAAGDCIAEAYDVIEVVDAGDLRTTYLAHHRQWDIDLMIKLPSAQLATVPGMLREWLASAERWAGLGVHPNIASCYSVQSFDGIPLAVTEYVGGASLRAGMKRTRNTDLQVALNVAIDICQGLEHAHSRGVIHGSLAPDNILISSQGAVKLSDFDMAIAAGAHTELAAVPPPAALASATPVTLKLASTPVVPAPPPAPVTPQPSTVTRPLLCAPTYIAPERWAAGYTAQPAADVFALGVCLYELFFGRQPYANTAGAPCPLPSGETLLNGEAPPEALLGLLRRCVEWAPFRRPAGIEAVRYDLSALYENLFGAPGGQVADPAQQAAEWNTKAVSYYRMGNETDAEAAWASALAADPTCLEVWFNRDVTAWRRGGLTDEAVLEDLGAVLVPRAERWKVCLLLALVNQERGDLESAQAALEEAHQARPDVVEICVARDRLRAAYGSAPAPPAIVGEHREYVTALALSANLRDAVSASYDGTVTLWDIVAAAPARVFEGHSAPVSTVCFNAAGSLVLTGSDDGTLRLWDAASGVCQRIFDTHSGRISSACLSPDGRWLLWAGIHSSEHVEQMTLQVWDTNLGRHVRTFEGLTSAVKSVCCSADGYWAVSGGDDQTVRIWEIETGKCQQVFTGHGHYVSAVAISPDNRLILSGSWDRSVRLWDVESGRLLRTFDGHSALVTSVCLSADAHWALSGSWDSSVRLWEVSTGRCVRTFRGHKGLVTGVALSADGQWGISGSWDRTVRRWDTAPERREPSPLRLATGHDTGAAAIS